MPLPVLNEAELFHHICREAASRCLKLSEQHWVYMALWFGNQGKRDGYRGFYFAMF